MHSPPPDYMDAILQTMYGYKTIVPVVHPMPTPPGPRIPVFIPASPSPMFQKLRELTEANEQLVKLVAEAYELMSEWDPGATIVVPGGLADRRIKFLNKIKPEGV